MHGIGFPNGFENAKYISDRWGPQLKILVLIRQLCTSHLLRDSKYLIERYSSQWAMAFKQLLYNALELKKSMAKEDFYMPNFARSRLLRRLNGLLEAEIDTTKRELSTFQKKMKKHRDCLSGIFTAFYYPQIQILPYNVQPV